MRSNSYLTMPILAFVIAITICSLTGCGRQSTDQAIDQSLKTAGIPKASVFPLAGTVTVDGQTPKFEDPETKLILMLVESKAEGSTKHRNRADCDSNGHFAFTTFKEGDGVPPGKYVIVFAELKKPRKGGLVGPDGLNNLYNDPEKNAQIPEFMIDHQSPGKTDYSFDLKVAGKEPVAQPGSQALAGQSQARGRGRRGRD